MTALRLVEKRWIAPRPIPERRPITHFESGHTLRIDHGHVAMVLRVKSEVENG